MKEQLISKDIITLILPVRNEKENLKILIPKIEKILGCGAKIIIVDGGSTDGLEEILNIFPLSNLTVVKNKKRGLGEAIKTGRENANSEIISWMDADLSMPLELIPEMVKLLSDYDIVLGSRYIKGGRDLRRSKIRVFTSRLFNLLSKKILNTKISDLTSGFIAIRKDVLDKLKIEGRYGEYCLSILFQAERKGFKIAEIPYIFQERNKGKSKISPNIIILFKNSLFYFLMLIKLKFRDLFVYRDNKIGDKVSEKYVGVK